MAYGLCGLAFFALGMAAALRASMLGNTALRNRLFALAGFGVLHGVFAWFSLAILIDPAWLAKQAVLTLGAISFAPLLYFALLELGWRIQRVHLVVAGAALIWLRAAIGMDGVALEAMMRWGWAAPVAACASVAVLRGRSFQTLKALAPQGAQWLAWMFGAYAAVQAFTTPGEFFPASLLNSESFEAIFGAPPIFACAMIALGAACAMLALLHKTDAAEASRLKAEAEKNQATLRAFLDAAPECVKVLNADGDLLDMNRAGLEMIGAACFEEVRGANVYGLIKPSYHDTFRAALAASFQGESTTIQFEIVGLNGVHRHMEQRAAPLYSPGDRSSVERVVAVTHDVTERVKSETALRHNARVLEQSQRIVSMGSWEWNIVTNDLAWNAEIYRIFGLEPAEFGASYPAFLARVYPDDREKVEEAVRAAVQDGAAYDIRHRIVRPDGAIRMVREKGEVEYGANGAPVRMLGVVHDITDAFRIEEDLRINQERLSSILNIAPEAVVVTDASGVITVFSAGAEDIFGYSSNEVIGRNVTCLMPARYRDTHGQHVKSFQHSSTPRKQMSQRQGIVAMRKNGEEFPAQASISRLVTLEGVVFTAILRDVTAEKIARQELLDSKASAEAASKVAMEAALRLEEAQRIANIGSWEWNAESNGEGHSEQTLRILGRTGVDATLPPGALLASVHPADALLVGAAMQATLDAGLPLDLHHRIVRPNGEERFVHTQARAVQDEAGRVVKLSGVMHDLTEWRSMRELLQAVRDAGEKARAESAAKTDFLSHMSHELRTPLNAIIGYSELMLEDAEEEGRQSEIGDHERVIVAAKHLLKLINGLLDLSKVEAGQMEAEIREFDAAEIAGAALDTIRPAAEREGNKLVLELDDGLRDARNDSFRLSQCLLNLLSNAAKFTKDGVVTLRGARERLSECDWLVFEIEDTGVGMSESQLVHLFKPFAQADASTARKHGGTGLGLVITKHLSQLMGGDLVVRSEKDRGTVFTLRILADLAPTRSANDHTAPDDDALSSADEKLALAV